MHPFRRALLALALATVAGPLAAQTPPLPSLAEVAAAKLDLWGEASLRETNGPSYEFFENLLPPPRYVNADFRYYPLVLSAPNTKTKARLISNGRGINLPGGVRSWNDVGTPVTFRVGPDEFLFGDLPKRLSHPTLAQGYLPIVTIDYQHPFPMQSEGAVPLNQKPSQRVPEVYRLEAFACTDSNVVENAAVLVKFSLAAGKDGIISADFSEAGSVLHPTGKVTTENGKILAAFDAGWKWDRGAMRAKLTAEKSVYMAVFTRPLATNQAFAIGASAYDQARAQAVATWQEILGRGMKVEVPEPVVQNAWRNLLLQNFTLLNQDRIFYSAGNQYEKIYEAEGSDAALTMMQWGYEAEMRRMLPPLLEFNRSGLEYHIAGLKLNDLVRYYWQTRDAETVLGFRKYWEQEANRIVSYRTNQNGLLPKERYCGDISTPVFSVASNAKAWRALRDFAVVLSALGETNAAVYEKAAAEFRPRILDAINRSLHRETSPPFLPLALLSEEAVHSPITSVRIGSYWNIVIGYFIGSGIFAPGSEEETWLPHYQEQHGGLCMGLVRSGGATFGFWTGSDRINPLYGLRYSLDVLRRDEPERALVSFYGMLAQGFTRQTFVSGEGCTLAPVDEGGRFFYCPPNSSGNAFFLSLLRHLLVQDFDLDNDGTPETLRLLFGTSRRWLEDGKNLRVEKAPTVFGPVSVRVESQLAAGEIRAEVTLPDRYPAAKTLLRLRVPEGWEITGGMIGTTPISADAQGTFDLTNQRGQMVLKASVRKR